MHFGREFHSFRAIIGSLFIVAGIQGADRIPKVFGTPDNHFKRVNTYPEYWVDGKPFFEHAGAFFYPRIPRDRWWQELVRLKNLGINTIDLYLLWNWHEPEEGSIDFSGRTNPRRDLKYLIRLIELSGLKVTIRPGPYCTSEWRNGGYPDWLLSRPEYHESEQSILEARYPRLSCMQRVTSDQAAREWMTNATHLRYTRKWFGDALALFKPLMRSNNVLSIQIDDDQASFRENYHGPNFWKYMSLLRLYAKQATDNVSIPYYLNGYDMRVNSEANFSTGEPFWNVGQDYPASDKDGNFTEVEASNSKYLLETLKTQPLFTAGHIEFHPGWYLSQNDTYAPSRHPSNILIASRIMFQNGLKILNYYPPIDSISPTGYEFPSANHFYVWESAVDAAGRETEGAAYLRRNGRLIRGMGQLLASTHLLADAGLIYPMATFNQAELSAEEVNRVASFSARVLWSAAYNHYSLELVDSDHAPLDDFERYKVLLLPGIALGSNQQTTYPRLQQYSLHAQLLAKQYVEAGGTLLVFPSLPKGAIFEQLFRPFGREAHKYGDTSVSFFQGGRALALRGHSILHLPKTADAVKVFARDSDGSVVGAIFDLGKGHVMFYGADFSLWSVPKGSEDSGVLTPSTPDYPETVQERARPAFPDVLRTAGAVARVSSNVKRSRPRDSDLYVTELTSDWNAGVMGQVTDNQPGYGFVGVTNLSSEAVLSADIVATDPRPPALGSSSNQGFIRIPQISLPPHESLMLPLRIPLKNPYWTLPTGLSPGDEVYYATAEVSEVRYNGSALRFDITAPVSGEIAFRLSGTPTAARIDGGETPIYKGSDKNLYVVKIPAGKKPHYQRLLEVDYSAERPIVSITPDLLIAGEPGQIRVTVHNVKNAPLGGKMDLHTEGISPVPYKQLNVRVLPHAVAEFTIPVEVPREAASSSALIRVTLREGTGQAIWGQERSISIRAPIEFEIAPVLKFPIREDQDIPIVHPLLASIDLPGTAVFKLLLRNPRAEVGRAEITVQGSNISVVSPRTEITLGPGEEVKTQLEVKPTPGFGVYRFDVDVKSKSFELIEPVVLVALQKAEAVAYSIDYDRDGLQDLILENQNLRLFISPSAGARSFALVRKRTNINAFNSVGGMRDSFSKRVEPSDQEGLLDWTRGNWHGLYNRPYSFEILEKSGLCAQARLQYAAPDVFPKGAKLERTLQVCGDTDAAIMSTTVTPSDHTQDQSYVLESSVPFRTPRLGPYRELFTREDAGIPITPQESLILNPSEGFVGTTGKERENVFALVFLDRPEQVEVAPQHYSALIRLIYPSFTKESGPYTYRVAYCFGSWTRKQLSNLNANFTVH